MLSSRTETGGHWAFGEAWQDPGFDNPPHTHDEAEAFYVLEGEYTFYTDADPTEGIGPGTFVFIRDPEAERVAVAKQDDTVVLSLGGWAGKAFTPSEWETESLGPSPS